MLDLDLFADIAFVEDEIVDSLTKGEINQTIENNKALVEQPRVKTKKQTFLDATNHGVNNQTIRDDDKFLSPDKVEKITWFKGRHHQKVLVDDGIPEFRFENFRGYQVQICNYMNSGVAFQKNHCLLACVKWRNTTDTEMGHVWQNLGVIQINKSKVLIFKCNEMSRLKPTDMNVLLRMLRFRFGLVPNSAIADNCLLRIPDYPCNYTVFSLPEMQRYLGVELLVDENPAKPYRVLSDNRVQQSVKEQPKPSTAFVILSNDSVRKALKREQMLRKKAELRAEKYRLEAQQRYDELKRSQFNDSPVVSDRTVHKGTEIR